MRITELIKNYDLPLINYIGESDMDISGLQFDSRNVQTGDLFFAMKGGNFDGHKFISDAVERGAAAVVGSIPIKNLRVPYIQVSDTREMLAQVSASFFGNPARQLNMIAVTGTDGKTTTVKLIHQILLACGIDAGMISTVNAVVGSDVVDTGFHVTTPEAPIVQSLLRKMADQSITHVVLEATSHGLHQRRVSACEIDVAVITNITHEHLDYHGSYDAYFDAKFRLFEGLKRTVSKPDFCQRIAVVNYDDISYEKIKMRLTQNEFQDIRQISYGKKPEMPVHAKHIMASTEGLKFTAVMDGIEYPIESPLIGDYNVDNIMAAISATVMGLGLDMELAARGIGQLKGISGRMEKIDIGQEFSAIVDFAHTPNALKNALQTAKTMTSGRVIAVFGSAGLRDRQKRRMMAAESIILADISILTAEDPRTEKLDDILEEMADEARKFGGVENKNYYVIPDRGNAIRQAVKMAQKNDLVIACGKGHEQSMCFGEIEYDWDDRQALRAALSELLGKTGPDMPNLPTQSK